ncbi:hypothetical protein J3F84DRAFT_361200 [Trichoderma pleuroticola]
MAAVSLVCLYFVDQSVTRFFNASMLIYLRMMSIVGISLLKQNTRFTQQLISIAPSLPLSYPRTVLRTPHVIAMIVRIWSSRSFQDGACRPDFFQCRYF